MAQDNTNVNLQYKTTRTAHINTDIANYLSKLGGGGVEAGGVGVIFLTWTYIATSYHDITTNNDSVCSSHEMSPS